MKITNITQYFPRKRTRLIRISTDVGIEGWGETTLEGRYKTTIACVEELAEYLTGKDPLRIEDHWQHIYRSAFFRSGPTLMTALSGIDQALWDIAGKYYGVPIYKLLGGPVRDRIRVYAHWGIRDLEAQEEARERLDMLQRTGGYRAFKTSPGGTWHGHESPATIDRFAARAEMMREWVGPDCELAFDFHGKFTPALALDICRAIAGVRPMFVEEPIPQENVAALREVALRAPFPIATGERLLSRWEFRQVFELQAAAYVQPDVSHAGGISEMRRIAAMAETYYVHVAPHCAIGPVALAACMQVDAAIPNFLIQEQVDQALGADLLKKPFVVKDGCIELSEEPGLGIEIDETALREFIAQPQEELGGDFRHPDDGSVADW